MTTTMNKFAAAAIFTFIILAGNVRAEGNDATASSLENITETTLQLENWMTDATVWNVSATEIFAVETESELNLENWMIDDSNWKVKQNLVSESESGLNLENWMMKEKTWNI